MIGRRWYDESAKVSHAVNLIEKASKELKKNIANLIIKQATELGIHAQKPKKALFRRWYDKDEDLSLAMEYFKNADESQRQAIADNVIKYVSYKASQQ